MRLPTIVVRGDVLTSWLTVSDYTRSRLAMELNISKGRVSQLLHSQEEPSAHLLAKLMTLTHLPFERLFKVLHDNPQPFPAHDSATQIRKSAFASSARTRRKSRAVLVQS